MTENATADRPPQVTVAGWVTMSGSAFLVLGMFDHVARLRSIDSRESIAKAISEPPFDGLGLGLDGALSALHVLFVVAGALGAAACVLGWFVLQRHKPARLALTAVAVPLVLYVLVLGSLAAAFVVMSAMLLWSGPARDWFAGRPVRKPPVLVAPQAPRPPAARPTAPPDATQRVSAPHLPPTPPGVASAAPPPYAGYGVPRADAPYGVPGARPPALVAAVLITWVASAIVLVIFGISVAIVLADPSSVRDVMDQQPRVRELGLSADELRQAFVGMSLVLAGWALAAALLALLVMLRVAWARPLLIASAIASGLLSFFAFYAVAPLVTAVAGMVTAYLLLRPEVAQWVNRR
ncbi:hypothetical protein GCM10011584_31620 [Nocardioides phosphati]|uniref:DUF4064 domain-containing protein n=1 Tax=Nocardioides phosphati TaxID=1867775 RepID=A0ABQ2NEG9_9ACTN|nr:hypothetical protein [Nocardioides phosphati]GGO93280.1 hypothetical protein GCM10011584_31620 [Nocardioides phosphati]